MDNELRWTDRGREKKSNIYFFFFMHNGFDTQSDLCRASKHPLTRLLSLYHIASKKPLFMTFIVSNNGNNGKHIAISISYSSMNDIQRNVKNQSKYDQKKCYYTNIGEHLT
jgi:hypothetical protein